MFVATTHCLLERLGQVCRTMAAVSIHSSPGLGDAKMELDAGPSAPTSTASGTATPGEMTNGPRPALGNGIDSSSLDRPRSPVKPLPATTAYMPAGAVAEQDRLMARPQVAASKHDRPIDMRVCASRLWPGATEMRDLRR